MADLVVTLNSPEFQDDPIARQLGRDPMAERRSFLAGSAGPIAEFERIRKIFVTKVAPSRARGLPAEGTRQLALNERKERAESQIARAKRGRDAFSPLGVREVEVALRLIHSGHFDGAIEYARRQNVEYLNRSGTSMLFGLFTDFDRFVEEQLSAYRGETLIAQYILAKTDAVGLCGDPTTTFAVTVTQRKQWVDGFGIAVGESSSVVDRYTFFVPAGFGIAIEKADATSTNPILGPKLSRFVRGNGGCDSAFLRSLESKMKEFMAYRPEVTLVN